MLCDVRKSVRCHCDRGAPCNRNMHFATLVDGSAEAAVVARVRMPSRCRIRGIW
jgi:hypothetical protein